MGIGHLLRVYDIGKKKMLRKCENKHLPNLVVDIRSLGNRVYVSDVQEAVHFVRYKAHENQLIIFADETLQRSTDFHNPLGFLSKRLSLSILAIAHCMHVYNS